MQERSLREMMVRSFDHFVYFIFYEVVSPICDIKHAVYIMYQLTTSLS